MNALDKEIEIRTRINEAIKSRNMELPEEAEAELKEILLSQHINVQYSYKPLLKFTLIAFLVTSIPIALIYFFVEDQVLSLLSIIAVCTSLIIGATCAFGCTIYYRITRTELYLNTIHSKLLEKNNT